ncbi:HNH endonuclease [Mesorhizobium sp. BHbsci]
MAELTTTAVKAAIEEYDRLGKAEFLRRYGFGAARDYFLVFEGRNYDSKAIFGVAHKYAGEEALSADRFTGGKSYVAKKLRGLGFDVTSPGENADWNWDEHVLALDVYLTLKDSAFGKNHPAIVALSDLLQIAGEKSGRASTVKFRNVNGVYMKLMNFRRLDPAIQANGRVGLSRGSKTEVAVWKRYATDMPALKIAVAIVRDGMEHGITGDDNGESDEGSAEGSVIIIAHRRRERDWTLASKKKKDVLKKTGKLACDVCDVTFAERYGSHGDGFIEVHHNNPIALSEPGRNTRLTELSCVCSNCHRMLHRGGLQTIDWLKTQLSPPSSE